MATTECRLGAPEDHLRPGSHQSLNYSSIARHDITVQLLASQPLDRVIMCMNVVDAREYTRRFPAPSLPRLQEHV